MASTRAFARSQKDYSPIHWSDYFDEAHDVEIETISKTDSTDGKLDATASGKNSFDSFRVYMKNFRQPYAPKREFGQRLNASKLELSIKERESYNQIPTIVTLHGGGYSSLTWAPFSRLIDQHCHCRILAIDLRGHGDSKTKFDNQMDIDTLVSDVISVTHCVHQQICGFLETPKIILVGHSMGGAIAVKCASRCVESLSSLAGFVVIDVVEGTAKDALPLMMSVISTRPQRFVSLDNAIEWAVRSGMAKNIEAARVSMPGNLINLERKQLAIHDIKLAGDDKIQALNLKRHEFDLRDEQQEKSNFLPQFPLPSPRVVGLRSSPMLPPPVPKSAAASTKISPMIPLNNQTIREDLSPELDAGDTCAIEKSAGKDNLMAGADLYAWRTDLKKTQPYWNGWFDGLSKQLLEAQVQGKFLLLAGIDRLDKTLTIGQMQGKFMMKVLPKCGHAVHEDVPDQVATVIGDFLVRNKFATSKA